jgi:di/tricarboxylate transporter
MAIAAATFWLFAKGTIRIEVVSLLLIAVLALLLYFFPVEREGASAGIEIAFGGFGHEALIAICCLMILGRGLVVTGALEPAARLLTRLWRFSRLLGLLVTLIVAAGMSMIVNDTPVLVLLLPLLLNLAARIGASASKTLMPVNCAILIGGMATTIGTSTNLLVVSIAEDLGMAPFGVFDFTGIALMAGLVALPYLWLIMPRLLPANGGGSEGGGRTFQAALHITSSMATETLERDALMQKLGEHHLQLLSITGSRGESVPADAPIAPGFIVRVEGSAEHLREAGEALKATMASPSVLESLRSTAWKPGEDLVVAQLAIGADSALIDQTIRSAQIADRYGVAVIGFHRPDRTFTHTQRMLRDKSMEIGDVLLVQGTDKALQQLQVAEGAMVLAGAAEMPRTAKAPLALLIFAAAVAAAALHILPIAISALAGAIAMLATGCVKFERLGRALSGEVIVLVAASIALGKALLETGAAEWLGGVLAFGLQVFPPAGILAAMMAFAALLTNFSSNTAAAAVGTPIAFSLAQKVGVPPEPLVLAVLFGCNLCFATPVAYQTNILIMSAGGYQFRDYVRAGLPLVLLMIVTLSALLVWRYEL